MPSFSIGTQFESARITAKFYKGERSNIYNDAGTVVNACHTINVSDAKNNTFARELGRYLDTRRNAIHLFCDDNAQVANRSAFIRTLVTHITNNDVVQQVNMLREENIRRFKGFFTQRLYDILVSRRIELQQIQVAVNEPSRDCKM